MNVAGTEEDPDPGSPCYLSAGLAAFPWERMGTRGEF